MSGRCLGETVWTVPPGGPLSSGGSADSDWAAVIAFGRVTAAHECATVVFPAPHALGVHYGCTVPLGFIGWQGTKSRYPRRGLCQERVWGGWCSGTAAFSTASVLAAACFVLFSADAVVDGSGLSCPSSPVFLLWMCFLPLDEVFLKQRL